MPSYNIYPELRYSRVHLTPRGYSFHARFSKDHFNLHLSTRNKMEFCVHQNVRNRFCFLGDWKEILVESPNFNGFTTQTHIETYRNCKKCTDWALSSPITNVQQWLFHIVPNSLDSCPMFQLRFRKMFFLANWDKNLILVSHLSSWGWYTDQTNQSTFKSWSP